MDPSSTYEYVASPRKQPIYKLRRVLMILAYVAYVVVLLIIGMTTKLLVPMLALVPLSLWIIIFLTWRYVSVEYEYSITSGILTFAKIYGNRSRHTFLEIDLRQASRIAPLDNATWTAHADKWHPEREYSAISSLKAPDIYFILFEHSDKKKKEKRRTVFYFEATAKALQICRFYNPSATVLTKVSK